MNEQGEQMHSEREAFGAMLYELRKVCAAIYVPLRDLFHTTTQTRHSL